MDKLLRIRLFGGQSRRHHFDFLNSRTDMTLTDSSECDVALCTDESAYWDAAHVADFTKANIPVLHLADGILEWRNMWDNPRDATEKDRMPLFQPVLSHKIACIGPSQARLLEHWGNLGKCEILGSPRLDRLFPIRDRLRNEAEQRRSEIEQSGQLRLLIMTAKTPGFNDEQITAAERGLREVKDWIEKWNQQSDRPGPMIAVEWRITAGLDEKLGVDTTASEFSGVQLAEVLEQVDIVVSTPSTAMLEAMFLEKPLALLDFTNSPHYVPAAWRMTASEHVDPVMRGLIAPSPQHMLYQDYLLHDAWRCDEPAVPRAIELIQEMAEIGRACRAKGEPLRFPNRMVEGPDPTWPSRLYDPKALFPNHPILSDMDVQALRAEVGNIRLQINRIQRQHQNTINDLTTIKNSRLYRLRQSIRKYAGI